jgi:predicted acetyltransferase
MWSFLEVARIECNWGKWQALVTLVKNDVPESFWRNFNDTEPTMEQAAQSGVDLATQMNEVA